MTLSKQFLIIITAIFITIFATNFLITMQNTKEYIQEELTTKAKDTATSLGMLIKPYISNKKDSEIELIINAIADSGFYNEIRLEDAYYSFSKQDIINLSKKQISLDAISNVTVNDIDGKLETSDDADLEQQLNSLEDIELGEQIQSVTNDIYTFYPTQKFSDNQMINVAYTYKENNISKVGVVSLQMSNILYKKTRSVKFDNVPAWFVEMVDFELIEEQSEITDNWKLAAIIYVKANPGIAYEKLYIQFKTTITYALIIFIVFVFLISIFVKLLLRPLKEIEKVTSKIASCEFTKIKKIPWTKEFKSVALAINDMSDKLEKIINKLNDNIKVINKRLLEDPLTGLEMKESFMSDMKEHFVSKKEGYVILIQISDLGTFAKQNGRRTVDEFIKKFAKIIHSGTNATGYRFVGSEFMHVVHSIDEETFKTYIKDLQGKFEALGAEYNKSDVVHMGACRFNRFSTIPSVLSCSDESYKMAKMIGDNGYNIKDKDTNARGQLAWYHLIDDVIDNEKVKLDFMFETTSTTDKSLLMYEVFSKVLDEKDEAVAIGAFISLTEEKGRIIDFDKMVLSRVLKYIKDENLQYRVAINLSMTSMLDLAFVAWLESHFKNDSNLASKVILNVSAFSIKEHLAEFQKFIKIVNKLGIDVMIKRYESKFIDPETLKTLQPNLIRLAKSYTDNIGSNDDQMILVDSICNITNILNIQVIAECQVNDELATKLRRIGISGVSK